MLEAITLDGSNVSASIDAYVHDYFIDVEGVFKKGNEIGYEIVNNNLIKLFDGLILNKGRFLRIHPGTYEEIKIDNASPDVKRIDLILSHFETDGVAETLDIRVIKGDNDGTYPDIIKGDIFNGDLINQVPLYAIHINGIESFNVVDLREFIPSLSDMKKGSSFFLGNEQGGVSIGDYKNWLGAGKPLQPTINLASADSVITKNNVSSLKIITTTVNVSNVNYFDIARADNQFAVPLHFGSGTYITGFQYSTSTMRFVLAANANGSYSFTYLLITRTS